MWAVFISLVGLFRVVNLWEKLAFVPIITGNCGGPLGSGQTKARIDTDSSTPVRDTGNETSTTMYTL